jgi:uncharacterized protein YeaO (DUF488 family)
MIGVARVYGLPDSEGAARYLVDRIWPRGISKASLRLTDWLPAVAPSNELRRWFGHDPERWPEFRRRYAAELDDHPEASEPLLAAAAQGDVLLLYGAKDTEHNNAVALKEYLERRLSAQPSSSSRRIR